MKILVIPQGANRRLKKNLTILLTIDDMKPRLDVILCPLRNDWLPFRRSEFSSSLSSRAETDCNQQRKTTSKLETVQI